MFAKNYNSDKNVNTNKSCIYVVINTMTLCVQNVLFFISVATLRKRDSQGQIKDKYVYCMSSLRIVFQYTACHSKLINE